MEFSINNEFVQLIWCTFSVGIAKYQLTFLLEQISTGQTTMFKAAKQSKVGPRMTTDMTELEWLLSPVSVECWEKDVTADVQSCDADANHSLLPAHNHTATHYYMAGCLSTTIYWLLIKSSQHATGL